MNKATIHIVEDNGILASHMQEIVTRLGYSAGLHSSIDDSVSLPPGTRIDLNLANLELSGTMNDFDIEKINKISDFPVVFFAGLSHDPLHEQARIEAPCGYLIKHAKEPSARDKSLYRHYPDDSLEKCRAALEKSEARYQHLLDNSPFGIFNTTLDGKVLAVNAEMAGIVGCATPEEAIGMYTGRLDKLYVDPYRRKEFIALLTEKKAVKNFEYRARKTNGETIWVSMDARLVPVNEENRCDAGEVIEGFVTDITERKQLENVQTFLAQTSAGTGDEPFFNTLARYLAHNLDMDFVCIDRFAEDGLSATTVVVWYDRKIQENVEYTLKDTASGKVADMLIYCQTAGIDQCLSQDSDRCGSETECRVGVTMQSHSGEAIGNIFVIGRKTKINRSVIEAALKLMAVRAAGELERKEAGDALRKSEEQYRRIVDTAREGIWDLNRNWQTAFVNPHMAKMLGYEPSQMLGRVIDEFIHKDDLADHKRRKEERQQGRDGQYERRFLSKDGRDVWTIVSSTAQMDGNGQFAGSFLMLTDITKRKKAEIEKDSIQAQLVQAQKMESVGRLAGGVAHDFNNMLSVIIGNTELALTETEKGSAVYKELEEIKKAALKSADLTRQLLAFARKQVIAPKVINLNREIEGTLEMLRRLIGENIQLTWLPRKGLHAVFIDPSQVDQMLVNLSVNARDAIQGIGKIIIQTETVILDDDYCRQNAGATPGEYVLLSFSDNGCGVPNENLKQIFEPFFTTKKQGEGTGLGLSMIYGIVKQNGGVIQIDSKPGKGTTFQIYLPQHRGNSEKPAQSETLDIPQGKGETILLVEDEKAILELNRKMLEGMGYHVLATSSTAEAIDLALEHRLKIRILLTDVVMPDMDGYELAHKLLKMRPNLKCLFVSGYSSNMLNRQGFLPTGIQFLQKPVVKRDLAVKICEILKG